MRRFGKINIVAIIIIVFCGINLMKLRLPKEVRQVRADGIVATMENVERRASKVSMEVSLKKEDGAVFEEGEYINEVVCTSKVGGSNQIKYELSKDGKVLTYYIDRYLKNRDEVASLEIGLKQLIKEEKGSKILEKSIYDIYQEYPLEDNYGDRRLEGLNNSGSTGSDKLPGADRNIVPLNNVEGFGIVGVGFGTNYDRKVEAGKQKKALLYLSTISEIHEDEIENEAEIYSLYNEKTGEEINWIQSSSSAAADGQSLKAGIHMEVSETYYELTNTEKLKHIRPIINYTEREVKSKGEWYLVVNTKPE